MRVNTEVAMSHGLFLPNLFQLAYQTKDIEAAKRALEIHFGARTWQYSPVNEAAPAIAGGLFSIGIGRGEVGVLMGATAVMAGLLALLIPRRAEADSRRGFPSG